MTNEEIRHIMSVVRKACAGDKGAEDELRSMADTATFWNGHSVCVAVFSSKLRKGLQYGYVAVYGEEEPLISWFPLPPSFTVASVVYNEGAFYFVSDTGEIRKSSFDLLAAICGEMLEDNKDQVDTYIEDLFYSVTSGGEPLPDSVKVPFIGVFDYSEKTKTYATFHTHKDLGALSVTIKADDRHDMLKCMSLINTILGNAVELDKKAKALLAQVEGMSTEKLDQLRLASIDCYVNSEFDFFYDIADELLEWVTVCFSKEMEPINISYD